MAAGHGSRLTQHYNYADGAEKFTVLWVQHEVRNNIKPALGGLGIMTQQPDNLKYHNWTNWSMEK